MNAWIILLPAMSMLGLMILTHCYFGIHVLKRGIIFVDLALAQIAALGVSIAFLLGEDVHGFTAQAYGFAAALIAAGAFTGLRRIQDKTLREATIGIVYIVATALALVLLSRSHQGIEQLKLLFNGNILWTSWTQIGWTAAIYAGIALLHGVYYRRFMALSQEQGRETRKTGMLWEFIFFASFALTLSVAVSISGVLLVFACLIIPAFSAALLSRQPARQLLLAWGLGLLGGGAGLWWSVAADLPTGATVVVALGILPLIAATMRLLRRRA